MFRNTTSIGKRAESTAAAYLTKNGFKIVERNYKTRYCEIDIVAKKGNTIYFVEVKYRRQAAHGDGLEAVTPKKLRQMYFSAEFWLNDQSWEGDSQLAVVAVSGSPPVVDKLVMVD